MNNYSAKLIRETKKTFEPKYGQVLSDEEAEEIIDNMMKFAEILIESYEKEKLLKLL